MHKNLATTGTLKLRYKHRDINYIETAEIYKIFSLNHTCTPFPKEYQLSNASKQLI